MNQETSSSQSFSAWMKQGNRPVVLVVMLLTIAVIGIAALAQTPVQPMCCLFEDCNVTNSERQQILLALGASDLTEYKIENGRILVPVKELAQYLDAIAGKKALPAVFEKEQEFQPNLFLPRSQQAIIEKDRKKKQVRELIRRLPFVAEAWFEMDSAAANSMFEPSQQTALVMVTPSGQTTITRQNVESIQRLVSHTVAGLQQNKVAVIDSSVGITYQDTQDLNQSNLIELVNWTMDRKNYYLQRLHEQLADYAGIEIFVEVDRIDDGTADPNDHKIASEPQPKVAALKPATTNSDSQTQVQVGLNSPAAIVNEHLPCRDPFTSGSDIATVSYQAPLMRLPTTRLNASNNSPPERLAKANTSYRESVRVTVRVPESVLATIEVAEPAGAEATTQRLELLKKDIIEKVRDTIPPDSLAGQSPVSVILLDNGMQSQSALAGYIEAAKQLEKYWPVFAILLTAIFGTIWLRGQNVQQQRLKSDNSPPEIDEKQLQNQLSNLIDSDPATAAKVLKDWIRQTG